jgi:hypothetical protein
MDRRPLCPTNAATWSLYQYSPAYGACWYPELKLYEYGNAIFCATWQSMAEHLKMTFPNK